MSEIDELLRRVEAAKAALDETDHLHGREVEAANARLDDARVRLDRQDQLIRDFESRLEGLKGENRQLKAMLMSLLAAVESRSGLRINETLRDLGGQVAAMADAEPLAEPHYIYEPASDPGPDPLFGPDAEALAEPEPEPDESDESLPPSIRRMLFSEDEDQAQPRRTH